MGDVWEEMEAAMTNVAKAELGHKRKGQKHDWMTDEIMALLEEQRGYKNKENGDNHKKTRKSLERR